MSAPADTLLPVKESPARHRIVAYSARDGFNPRVKLAEISDIVAQYDTLLWLDILDPKEEDVRMLHDELGIHALALEEVMGSHPRPKCVEYAGYYVLVMYAVSSTESGEPHLREVVAFVGQKFIVTTHREPFPEIDECLRRWEANHDLQATSVAAPLYSFLDTIVDGYFPVLDRLTEHVEELEDEILSKDLDGPPTGLFTIKREMIDLRRVVSAQRDAINTLMRQDIQLFPEGSIIFFQSVFDHLVRQVETIDVYRDLLSTAADMHLSVISNRLNQVMKTLTAWSIILMAGSLIAGIYGMNFKYMPELHSRYGYFVALAAIATLAGSLVFYFRRIKWM